MKTKWKKTLLFLAASVLLLCALCACNNGDEQKPSDTTAGEENSVTETSGAVEGNAPIVLAKDGTVQYRLVYADDGETFWDEGVKTIADVIKGLVGSRPPVQREGFSESSSNQNPCIYFGFTRAAETAGVTEGLQPGEYRIVQKGESVFVLANSAKSVSAAITQLNKAIRQGKSGTSVTLKDFEKSNQTDAAAAAIPTYRNAWNYSVGGNSREMILYNAEKTDFTAYRTLLTEQGYAQFEEHSVQGLDYAAYRKDDDCLFVTYSSNELRVVYEPASECWLPDETIAAGSVETTGYLMGVYSGGQYQNGMCMFYLLSDGSFVIFDGGHNDSDATNLANNLRAVAKKNGISQIRISALIITHFHGDHCGFFDSFVNSCSKDMTIDRAVMLDCSSDMGDSGLEGSTYYASSLAALKTAHPEARTVRLHTGQVLTLGDMQLEMLYTPADLAYGTLTDYNDASMVMRLTVNGKNILMTGDAGTATWNLLAKKYGTYLKSDFLQVPHHGAAGGGTTEAYDLIRPEKLYWPAGETLYEQIQAWNNPKIWAHLTSLVKKENIFIAGVDGKLTEFKFQ